MSDLRLGLSGEVAFLGAGVFDGPLGRGGEFPGGVANEYAAVLRRLGLRGGWAQRWERLPVGRVTCVAYQFPGPLRAACLALLSWMIPFLVAHVRRVRPVGISRCQAFVEPGAAMFVLRRSSRVWVVTVDGLREDDTATAEAEAGQLAEIAAR